MCGVIVVDAGRSRSTNIGRDGYRHEYLKFYQLPNSNLFTHRLLFFSREATSETYGPRVFFLIYLPLRSTFLLLLFSDLLIRKPKNTLLQFILIYFIWHLIYQSTRIYLMSVCLSWGAATRRDWQPLLHIGLRVFVICVQVLFTLCCLVVLLVR